MVDQIANFAYSQISIPPYPATTGSGFAVMPGGGSSFPKPPFNATIWPLNVQPLSSNAEIVRVTTISGDGFFCIRAQEGTTAKPITAGYQIAQTITSGLLTQLINTSGGIQSISGPGKTESPGLLVQSGGLTVTDFNGDGVNVNTQGNFSVFTPEVVHIDGNSLVEINSSNEVILSAGGSGNIFIGAESGSSGDTVIINGSNFEVSDVDSVTITSLTGVSVNDPTSISLTSSGTITVSGQNLNLYGTGNFSSLVTSVNTISGVSYTNQANISTISGVTYTNQANIATLSGNLVTTNSNVATISGIAYAALPQSGGTIASLTVSGNLTVSGTVSLNNALTVGNGGTGLTSAGVKGSRLVSNGTTYVSQAPSSIFIGSPILSVALTSGVAATSLSVNALSYPMNSGSTLNLLNYPSTGGSTVSQSIVLSSGVAAGATTLPVNSFTPTLSFPSGTEMRPAGVALPINTMFPNATQFLVTVTCGGGGGGGAGTASSAILQAGGAGGAGGNSVTQLMNVGASTVATVTIGAGGYGGTAGAPGGNAGSAGGAGGLSQFILNGNQIIPLRNTPAGNGSAASSTTAPNGGVPFSGSTSSTSYTFPGGGGTNIGAGGVPIGSMGFGGGGGAAASATNGGSPGNPATLYQGSSLGTNGGSATISGVQPANANPNTAAGGMGGSAGATGTGTSSPGGAGGSGYILIEWIN